MTAVTASKKVQLSLTGIRQCAFHRAIDAPCTSPQSLPKAKRVAQNNFFTNYCVAFQMLVAGNRRH